MQMYGDKKRERSFARMLKNVLKTQHFMRFDEFIIRDLLELDDGQTIGEEERKQAWLVFKKRTHSRQIASLPTMRKWFGLTDYARPHREHIFEMALVMQFGREKTQEYLMHGILEPSFQINDYQELIYLYGLDNGLTFETCQKLIAHFELQMDASVEILQTQKTSVIQQQYEEIKHKSTEEFMLWMTDNTAFFKGYSKTTLEYFVQYKVEIIKYIRSDALAELEDLLAQTDYAAWRAKKRLIKRSQKELIGQYVALNQKRKKNKLSDVLVGNILELSQIAYSDYENNSLMLSEVFAPNLKGATSCIPGSSIKGMSAKHLSDILNVATQKERAIRVAQSLRQLTPMKGDAVCPEYIQQLVLEYSKGKAIVNTVDDAKDWLGHFQKEQKRRQLLLQRSDLLPLVLYIAQRRYFETIDNDLVRYDAETAKQYFIDLANGVLNACNMATIHPEYELDMALLVCFQEKDFFNYSDILEVLYGNI